MLRKHRHLLRLAGRDFVSCQPWIHGQDGRGPVTVSARLRRWVPVGSWTVSTHPSEMADAVRNYAAMGYTWMKYHLSPFENVFDQLEAMEQVAPQGFKLQFDLTRFHHYGHNPDLVERVARSPIAGSFEDPLDTTTSTPTRLRNHPYRPSRRQIQPKLESARAPTANHRAHKLGMILQRAGLFARLPAYPMGPAHTGQTNAGRLQDASLHSTARRTGITW